MAKRKRAEVQGFEEGGEFHPIRASNGYDQAKANRATKRKSRDKRLHSRKRH